MFTLILAMTAAAQSPVEVGDLPHYNSLPDYSQNGIKACKAAYSALEVFEGHFEDTVWDHTLTRGGKLSMQQNIAIRLASNNITQSYENAIRRFAWQGRGDECWTLSRQGQQEITERVIRPVFG